VKIGLITYHSAYNFGSVLQAYATQETLKEIAGNCEIINYRTNEQRRVYSIFSWRKNCTVLFSVYNNVLALLKYHKKKKRRDAYEKLFQEIFHLSEECSEPEDVYRLWDRYDMIVSGSDQIWNKHSVELHYVSWNYMMPYLLCGYSGKKVSYASSVANMSDEEIEKILPYINQFDSVSMREYSSAKKLNDMCHVRVDNVLDPTFLLSEREWADRFHLQVRNEPDYILFYALNRRRDIKEVLPIIEKYSDLKGLKVKMITPLGFFKGGKNIEILEEVDPVEFLNLIYNARTVITDSYHGTIFSVNFSKDFYSICGKNPSDFRKTDILERIGLQGRIINSLSDLLDKEYDDIAYSIVDENLKELKEKSLEYLKQSISQNEG